MILIVNDCFNFCVGIPALQLLDRSFPYIALANEPLCLRFNMPSSRQELNLINIYMKFWFQNVD
jgi:hypothetical protein